MVKCFCSQIFKIFMEQCWIILKNIFIAKYTPSPRTHPFHPFTLDCEKRVFEKKVLHWHVSKEEFLYLPLEIVFRENRFISHINFSIFSKFFHGEEGWGREIDIKFGIAPFSNSKRVQKDCFPKYGYFGEYLF